MLPSLTHFLFTILTCAHRMRVHFCPQHWLLCHLKETKRFRPLGACVNQKMSRSDVEETGITMKTLKHF